MSTYCFLVCMKCREKIYVKDADYYFVAENQVEFTQFLEKHYGHHLEFVWEDEEIESLLPDEAIMTYEIENYQPQDGGFWSHGRWVEIEPGYRIQGARAEEQVGTAHPNGGAK